MPGSAILNHRQHVGLQKLSALSAISTQFLGPNKSYKFIQDESTGESTLVSSCLRVLENLELTCAVAQLVYETIEAHHRIYKSGSGCVLFMAGAWSRTVSECLQLGIPFEHIIPVMSQGLDICLSVCKQYSITIQELLTSQKPIAKNLAEHEQAFISGTQRKLKRSRYFCNSESKNLSTCTEKQMLPDIAKSISHGCSESMNLVVKAGQIQSTFDVTKISTCLLPGGSSEEHACVLPGCVVLVSTEQALVAHKLKGQELKVALIDGDLIYTYRHLGFNKPKGLQRVWDSANSENPEEEWLDGVLRLLLNLEVKVLLISGVANGKLMDQCWRHNILVVEKVKLPILKAFAATTRAILLSYATQLNTKCVGIGVTVNVWKDLENKTALNISASKNDELVTAVLTSCVQGKLQSLEDRFWACAYRLHWAVKDGALLPGVGAIEMACIHRLQNQLNGEQMISRTAPYVDVVLQLMADGLLDYICTVMVNTGEYSKLEARTMVTQQLRDWDGSGNCTMFLKGAVDDSQSSIKTVCDNLIVKQEAWRKALDLVFLVLQTDAEVITGVEQNSEAGQRDLMFL